MTMREPDDGGTRTTVMANQWRAMVSILFVGVLVATVTLISTEDEARSGGANDLPLGDLPMPHVDPLPRPTIAPDPVRLNLEQLIPETTWHGASPLEEQQSPIATFRRRLVPSSWDVIDSAGTLFAPGQLTLEFHEGVRGESPDWVGVSNGCTTNGWLIEWLEGDGDIGLIRRVRELTIQVDPGGCGDVVVDWPFPKGWVRVSFDGDQLILGRQRTDLLATRTDRLPVNPAEQLDSADTFTSTVRSSLVGLRFDLGEEDPDHRRVPLVAIEAGNPDWLHTYDGCRRRSSWISEWTENGFVAESSQLPMSTRRTVVSVTPCRDSVVHPSWLHDGFVEVVPTDDGFELRRNDRAIELRPS